MNKEVLGIYKKLYAAFGSQHWWPAETPFEVIIGAILTQNTAWSNVEKAIRNLRKSRLLSLHSLSKTKTARIAKLIKPSGYYNLKAGRLRNFLNFANREFGGQLAGMLRRDTPELREALLKVKGIGPETADSILLYAANKPVFVIDAYTRRIFSRHGLVKEDSPYSELQQFFQENLPKDVKLYNEYHALIVKTGKELCRKSPRCGKCPLRNAGKITGVFG